MIDIEAINCATETRKSHHITRLFDSLRFEPVLYLHLHDKPSLAASLERRFRSSTSWQMRAASWESVARSFLHLRRVCWVTAVTYFTRLLFANPSQLM